MSMETSPWPQRIGLEKDDVEDADFRQLYPFADRFADVGGYQMHYVDEGKGEPVVMVHGNPTWSFFYRRLAAGLGDSHRCLVPDHIGCGFSDKPARYDYVLEKHIANLAAWIEHVLPDGQQFNLIVHDWGGPIGMGYAVDHPERIKRVVILNTSAFTAGSMPLRIRLCRVPLLGALLVRGFNLFAGLATLLTTAKPLPGRVRKSFVLPYNSWANRIAVHRFVQDIPLKPGSATYNRFRLTEDKLAAALADKPMLIQWGLKDWCFTPYFLQLWRKRFPRAEVNEYPAGHYLLEDAGDAILERIRTFLAGEK